MREAMAPEPFIQRGVVLGVGLDLAQGLELRLRCGMLALRDAERLGGLSAPLFGRGVFGLQRLECALGGG